MITPRALAVVTSMMLASSAGCDEATPPIVPLEIANLAQSIGCEIPKDHYSNTIIQDPPYVYGVLPDDPLTSAAFWCEMTDGSNQKLVLVLARFEIYYPGFENNQSAEGTPPKIGLPARAGEVVSTLDFANFDGTCGLRLRGTNLPLSNFLLYPEMKPSGLNGTTGGTNAIDMTAADIGCGVYYFDGNRWYYMPNDW